MKKWHSKKYAHCYCYERNGTVYLSLFGQKFRKSTYLKWTPENKELALKLLDQTAEKFQSQEFEQESLTLFDLIEMFKDYKFRDIREDYKRRINLAIGIYITDSEIELNDSHKIEIMIFKNVGLRKKAGYSNNYIKKQLSYIEQIFNFGSKRNLVNINPAKLVNEEIKDIKIDREAFPENQIKLLLNDLKTNNKKCYYAVKLVLNTGMRIQELVNIKSKDIDFDRNVLTIYGKGERLREFTLEGRFENVRELLKEILQQGYDNVYLFDWNHVGTPQKAFRRACKRLGIYKRGMNFHSIRKTFINQLADENYPLRHASELVGHTIRIMEKHYLKRTSSDKQAEISKRHQSYISQK